MNNNFPQGQNSQNPGGMNNGRVYLPARSRMMRHHNGMQAQTPNYVQPQAQQGFVYISPQIPTYPLAVNPYGGQQPNQAGPPPGTYMQNNVMGTVYAPSPYNNPVSLPHPAPATHNVMNVWNHPAEGVSQLASVSPHSVANQPHYGHAFPNNGMDRYSMDRYSRDMFSLEAFSMETFSMD
ncbi:hypothetical protein INS49_004916 [Diaporthe citri]|uniref:uncharacterized protein n=1 Tax=Diaporthe citri TaxID=83186 RepID=UPI001C80DCDB|nr:uncharacterized protein INS49_004916 [Diaporthe citri]KAG6354311.1 hypothetical protein INS49_004916 [Diaporthe citri]